MTLTTTVEAFDLLVDMTLQCSAARAERDLAIAERDAEHVWLRAALRCNVELVRTNDKLRADLLRERRMHADLRQEILLAGEPV